jgi:hypothetical protein
VAVTPNGNIGITWYRWIVDNNTGLYNYNIYFAVLSNTGTVLLGPSNLTNNDQYDSFDNLAVPHFFSPSIAGTDDNRFILSWQNYQTDGNTIFNNNIWYTTHDSNGAGIFAPTPLTNDDRSNTPILDTLSNGNAIVTWNSYVLSPAFQIYSSYAVIAGSGSITKAATPLDTGGSGGPTTDSIHLPNGNTAIAIGQDNEVALMILDPDYNILAGPTFATTPNTFNIFMSVTHDEAGNIVMTWLDGASDPSSNLYYALADSSGTFLTHPTLIRNSASGLISSENGQGNAPILPAIQMMEVDIDVVPASPFNIIIPKAFLVPVAILSADGFNAVSDVHRSSLTFGKTGDEASLLFCLKNGFDVNRDGRRDLICSFRISKTGLTTGDTQAILHGTTAGGTAFEGTDSIKVRKGGK